MNNSLDFSLFKKLSEFDFNKYPSKKSFFYTAIKIFFTIFEYKRSKILDSILQYIMDNKDQIVKFEASDESSTARIIFKNEESFEFWNRGWRDWMWMVRFYDKDQIIHEYDIDGYRPSKIMMIRFVKFLREFGCTNI